MPWNGFGPRRSGQGVSQLRTRFRGELRAEESYDPDPEALLRRKSNPGAPSAWKREPAWAKNGTQLVQSLLPDSRVAVLEGEGHIAILTAPGSWPTR